MKNKSVLKRVLSVIGHFKISLALSLVISVASVILTLYIPVLAGNAIDGISAAGGLGAVADNARALPGYLSLKQTYDVSSGAAGAYGPLRKLYHLGR